MGSNPALFLLMLLSSLSGWRGVNSILTNIVLQIQKSNHGSNPGHLRSLYSTASQATIYRSPKTTLNSLRFI